MKLFLKNRIDLQSSSKRGGVALLLAIGVLALLPIAMILAAPGDLDPNFDGDGKVTTDADGGVDEANDLLVQPDGKILAAGSSARSDFFNDFALARYNSDGSPDTGFGSNGVVLDDFGLGSNMMVANGVDLQADGKIIVAGWGEPNTLSDFAIARYTTNGSLDTSFGGVGPGVPQGTLFWDFNNDIDRANAVVVQDDDKIVVAGFAKGSGTQYDFALARFNADGTSPDPAFGQGGVVTRDAWNGFDEFKDVTLQADGKIVAVGYGSDGTPWPFVARYNADGTPDANFGTWSPGSGFQIIDQFQPVVPGGWTNASANGVALQDDGKIVVVGDISYSSGVIDFVARFNSNGTLDTSFGSGGLLVNGPPTPGLRLADVAIQSDGKIILSGTSLGPDSNTNGTEFTVARINPDGTSDFTFGENSGSSDFVFGQGAGNAYADLLGSTDTLAAIALQSDGKIVAAGTADQGEGNTLFGLARFEGDPPPVTIVKQANPIAVQPGDTLTYTLNFQTGAGAGSGVIIDDLPGQLQNYNYTLSPGLVVTETGGTDYTWQADIPAGGGTITISGTVDNTISQDTTFNNIAQIDAQGVLNQDNATVIVDVTPPNTLINGPSNPSNQTTPSIPLNGDDGAGSGIASFECNLDGGGWSPCSNPYTTPSLSEGQHTLEARAIDNVGLVDPTPANNTWEVDLTPPSAPTLLSPADGSLITDTDTVTLTWTEVVTPEAAVSYEITFGGPGLINVDTNEFTNQMTSGVYTWSVAAYDAAGNRSDYSPARTFTLLPSDVIITLDPTEPTSLTQSSPGGGQVTVDIPAGAVSEETILAYKGTTTPDHPTGNLKFAGQAFSLEAIQNNQLVDGLTFQTPITLTIEYTDDDVNGLDEDALTLYFYEEAFFGSGQWSTDGITVVERDTDNNKIVVSITHLTDFALFEEGTAGVSLYLPFITKQE